MDYGLLEAVIGNLESTSVQLLGTPVFGGFNFVWENSRFSNIALEEIMTFEFYKNNALVHTVTEAGVKMGIPIEGTKLATSPLMIGMYLLEREGVVNHYIFFEQAYQFHRNILGNVMTTTNPLRINEGETDFTQFRGCSTDIAEIVCLSHPITYSDYFDHGCDFYEGISITDQEERFSNHRSARDIFQELFAEQLMVKILELEEEYDTSIRAGLFGNIYLVPLGINEYTPEAHIVNAVTLLY